MRPAPSAAAPDRPRVALFVTCLVDLFRPSIGFAAIRLPVLVLGLVTARDSIVVCNGYKDAEFIELMHEYRQSIIHFDETKADSNAAYGYLNITLDQPRLKRINWNIHYLSAEGVEDQFIRNFWLHENSMYWEQYGLRDMSYLSNGEEE